jgi:hypothetical protein
LRKREVNLKISLKVRIIFLIMSVLDFVNPLLSWDTLLTIAKAKL